MKANFDTWLSNVLIHEGGYVDHPDDPGGPTNKGITIGTLKRLGIDVDGDGDSDIADLKKLRREDVARVYRLFYWDAVRADLLPSGVDTAVADFAVNSGPSRAAKHLQSALGVAADGDIGPKTIEAASRANSVDVIRRVTESRMEFLRGLRTFKTFGKGWTRRVMEVQSVATMLAARGPALIAARPVTPKPVDASPAPKPDIKPDGLAGRLIKAHPGWLAAIIAAIAAAFKRNSP